MRNKLKSIIFIFFCFSILCKSVNSNEPFVFNVTEIEILENGNQINGYKGGTATSKDGSIITAENFFYNKLTNILEAIGNVKYLDISNDIIITSDKALYLKNDEKVYTTGNSKAVNKNNTKHTKRKLKFTVNKNHTNHTNNKNIDHGGHIVSTKSFGSVGFGPRHTFSYSCMVV